MKRTTWFTSLTECHARVFESPDLVDGNSTDGTVEVAKRLWPNVTVITQNGMGKVQCTDVRLLGSKG